MRKRKNNAVQVEKREFSVNMRFSHCALPPVKDALVIGKRAPVGANSVVKALQTLSPGMFKHIKVEHQTIESILVRESDLRKIPEELLVSLILDQAAPLMNEEDALNVELDLRVSVKVNVG